MYKEIYNYYNDKFILYRAKILAPIIDFDRKRRILFGNKINVAFICHRPEIWSSLKSLYECMIKDKNFNVYIVTIPNKKQIPEMGLRHEEYISEGAEDYFINYKGKIINAYNYKNKTWKNLEKFRFDYIFFQTPYNVCRPFKYSSKVVSCYSKICYVPYGMQMFKGNVFKSVTPSDYMEDVAYTFVENKPIKKMYVDRLKGKPIDKNKKVVIVGYTRFDKLESIRKRHKTINKAKDFKIIWTPRWTVREGNCHFFEYKDFLFEYVENHNLQLIYRPHPQTFAEYIENGDMSNEELNILLSKIEISPNINIDYEKEYIDTFFETSVLITDTSSIIPEYFVTEKPIIYCHKLDEFNEFSKKIAEGFYWVHNWNELYETLEMLRLGKDPLLDTRKKIINEAFYFPPKGAGYKIKSFLKRDFYSKDN